MSKPAPHFYLPDNHPVINVSDEEVGKGWRRVPHNAPVKTHFQVLLMHENGGPRWRISSYFTDEGYRNRGFAYYREPASLRAWLTVAPQVVGKWRVRLWAKLAGKKEGA